DVLPVLPHIFSRGAELPVSGTDAIDVVDEDLNAPAAAQQIGVRAADAPFNGEVPGGVSLDDPDPLVVLRGVGHVQGYAGVQPVRWGKVRCRRGEPRDEGEALPLRTGGPPFWGVPLPPPRVRVRVRDLCRSRVLALP